MVIKKNIKILIIIVSILILSVAVFYLVNKKNANNQENGGRKIEIMTDDEKNAIGLYHLGVYEVISRDENQNVTSYKLTKLEDEKPISIEFMTEEEKAKKSLYTPEKIQVLQRDKNGEVVAYKIIKSDSDVISRY